MNDATNTVIARSVSGAAIQTISSKLWIALAWAKLGLCFGVAWSLSLAMTEGNAIQ